MRMKYEKNVNVERRKDSKNVKSLNDKDKNKYEGNVKSAKLLVSHGNALTAKNQNGSNALSKQPNCIHFCLLSIHDSGRVTN